VKRRCQGQSASTRGELETGRKGLGFRMDATIRDQLLSVQLQGGRKTREVNFVENLSLRGGKSGKKGKKCAVFWI